MNQIESFDNLDGHLETSQINFRVSGFELVENRNVGVTFVAVLRRAWKSLIAYLPLVQFLKRKSSLFKPRLITDMGHDYSTPGANSQGAIRLQIIFSPPWHTVPRV